MKTLKNPSGRVLSLALIPIPLLLIYVIITRSAPIWVYVVGIASFALYIILMTIFCIKQKCYKLLWYMYFITAMFVLYWVAVHYLV